ncbi:MAG TPA: hypothetical protein PKK12_13105, partial [Candidatus Aminicenantes bacterium]|nr:hypothetical protein [Candidatus Aminicenantes bacterium]
VASQYSGGDLPSGTLTVEIPVAFLRTGQVTFPAVEFRFYDPGRGRVESVRTVPFTVAVTGQVGAIPTSVRGTPLPAVRDNPAPPMTGPLPADPDLLPGGRWFWLLVAVPFLLPLGLLGKRIGWNAWRRAHPVRVRDRALREALALLADGSSPGDIPPAFTHYLTLRVAAPAGAATAGELAAVLEKHAISAPLRQRFLDLWQEASRLRYTPPSGTAGKTQDWRLEAESLLQSIDREWR